MSVSISVAIVLIALSAGYRYITDLNTQQVQKNQDLSQQLANTQQQLSDLANKPQPVAQTMPPANSRSVSDIVNEWSPQVVFVDCTWYYSDQTFYMRQTGSGFLTPFDNGTTKAIMTNAHVLLDLQNKYAPSFCNITFLNGEVERVNNSKGTFGYSKIYDMAEVQLPNITPTVSALVKRSNYYCDEDPKVGDNIVVLGYPAIGATRGVTATAGIISGFDGIYAVVDAKIDHGNSGGIAVSVKDDCIIGMPTSSLGGSLESLGRILPSRIVTSKP